MICFQPWVSLSWECWGSNQGLMSAKTALPLSYFWSSMVNNRKRGNLWHCGNRCMWYIYMGISNSRLYLWPFCSQKMVWINFQMLLGYFGCVWVQTQWDFLWHSVYCVTMAGRELDSNIHLPAMLANLCSQPGLLHRAIESFNIEYLHSPLELL